MKRHERTNEEFSAENTAKYHNVQNYKDTVDVSVINYKVSVAPHYKSQKVAFS